MTRIEDVLDQAVPQWRERAVWQGSRVVTGATGAIDPPGTTWRDRPGIDQGDGLFLAGDAVAAPGLLSEVAVNSGIEAGRQALAARRRRLLPAGWPGADLTPERRLAVLAAVLPGAALGVTPAPSGGWPVQPVDQTGLGYRLTDRGGVLRGEAASAGPGGAQVTTLAWNRLPRPARGRLNRRLARWWGRRR